MAESQNKKIAESFKGFKDDLDAMLDEASAESLIDEDEAAIERLLMGPGYEDKAAHEQAIDDDIDALLNSAQKLSVANELQRPVQTDVAQNIDALLDKATEAGVSSSLPKQMEDYLDKLNDNEDEYLFNGSGLEPDILEQVLNDKVTENQSANNSAAKQEPLPEDILKELPTEALILGSNFDADALDILLDHHTANESISQSKQDAAVAQASGFNAFMNDEIDVNQEPLLISEELQDDKRVTPQITPVEEAFDSLISDFELDVLDNVQVAEEVTDELEVLAAEDESTLDTEKTDAESFDVDVFETLENSGTKVGNLGMEPPADANERGVEFADALDTSTLASTPTSVTQEAVSASCEEEIFGEQLTISEPGLSPQTDEIAVEPVVDSLTAPRTMPDIDFTDTELLDLEVTFEPEDTGKALDTKSDIVPDLTDRQGTIVAESEQPQTVEKPSESDFLMADFDISSDDFPDIIVVQPVEDINVQEREPMPVNDSAAMDAEEVDEFAEDTANIVALTIDEPLDAVLDAPSGETVESEAAPLIDSLEPQITVTQDPLDPALLGQITALWAAHDLLKQQLSASATQPTSNEYLADELEMLAKEQKVIRRSIDSNNKKVPVVSYVALGLGILGLLLGGGLLTMKVMDSGQFDALVEQNAALQQELETLKHNSTSVNPEEINTALAEVTVKVSALEKQSMQHNPMPLIEELQATVNELKSGLGNKTDTANVQTKIVAEVVKPPEIQAEVIKPEAVKLPPISEITKPEVPKVVLVKPEPPKVPSKPKKALLKVEPATKVIATVVKPEKPKPIASFTEVSPKAVQLAPAGHWVANLVSFRQDWYAQGKAAEFARQGVFVQVVPVQVKGETWYRLRSNTFANRTEAQSYAGRAKRQLNLTSVWVTEE